MRTYRFYFIDDRVIRGRFDFQAADDYGAAEIAEVLFEACSDRCQSWEIWEGEVLLLSGPQKPRGAQLRASDLAERRQENIVQHEETILHSDWAIASSRRLLAELDKLKASKGAPFPH
jgi:hypothetical protein